MKKIKILKCTIILLVLVLKSCSSDGGDTPPQPEVKSITLSTTGLLEVLKDVNTDFKAIDDNGNDITSKVDIYVDDAKISSTRFKFNEEKSYEVYAKFNEIISPKITVKAIESTHTTKVLIEDYTGTWCGYCPRVAHALEAATDNNSKIIPVALHDDQAFPFPGVKVLESLFQVTGFPAGRINRMIEWDESSSQAERYLNEKKNLGIAINSSLSGDKISVDIKVHYDVKSATENKLVVYILENGLVASQANYYNNDANSPWYQKGNPITDFVHNHTARSALTDLKGDVIPENEITTGGTYSVSFSDRVLPSSIKDTSKLEIVAFVVDDSKSVINVQKANVGENKDFD